MTDLSVVGLDTRTGRSVHVDDAPKYVWNEKGYTGDQSLVCWHCYHGADAPAGTLVPLQCRGGKKYGKVRTHFAHPPGMAPAGGHHPETLWHANAKQALLRWALAQAAVADAAMEYWTPDGRRRSDIQVNLHDGTQLVVEVQQQPLTDEQWTRRHQDYTAVGLTDIWLWHPRIGVPGIARDEPQCHWQLSTGHDAIGIPIAQPHGYHADWWNRPDHRIRAPHHPPCPGDPTDIRWHPLPGCALGPTGFVLPAAILAELREATAAVARRATEVRERCTRTRTIAKPAQLTHIAPPRPRIMEPAVTEPEFHEVHRIDALPPHADPDRRRYRCQICNWVTRDVFTDGLHKLIEYP